MEHYKKHWPEYALVLVFFAVLVLLTGCARQPQQIEVVETDTSGPRKGIEGTIDWGVWAYIDPDTGCEYLYTVKGGITPRMEDKGGGGLLNPQKGCSYDIDRRE